MYSAVPLAVLLILTVLGYISTAVAIVAGLVMVVGIGCVVWRYLSDLRAIEIFVEQLARDGQAEAPETHRHGSLPELAVAISQMSQSWEHRDGELNRLAESTEMILQTLPQPLVLIDGERRVVRATAAARDLLGDAAPGDDLAMLLRNPDVLEAADRVIAGSGVREEVELSIPFPQERHFSAWVVPLPNPAADGTVAILSLYDMTARRRSDQMRVDFIANASHELRTPLSVLVGAIKTLRGAARDDKEAQERFLSMMEAQADRMARLVDDLLSLSRIEMNEHRAPSAQVDLPKLIGQVTDSLEFPASARNVRLAMEASADIPAVAGDESELTQLFQNLIDNAIKYGREGSTVTVSIEPSPAAANERDINVTIADEGDGIAPEHLPRLTERFYRVDTGRSREMGGTGLGLAIVKHIVGRHRGDLKIESEVGEGSRFIVSLPAAAESIASAAPKALSAEMEHPAAT